MSNQIKSIFIYMALFIQKSISKCLTEIYKQQKFTNNMCETEWKKFFLRRIFSFFSCVKQVTSRKKHFWIFSLFFLFLISFFHLWKCENFFSSQIFFLCVKRVSKRKKNFWISSPLTKKELRNSEISSWQNLSPTYSQVKNIGEKTI